MVQSSSFNNYLLRFIFCCNLSILSSANGEGFPLSFSQRLIVEYVTPILAANCSCVRPRAARSCLIILDVSCWSMQEPTITSVSKQHWKYYNKLLATQYVILYLSNKLIYHVPLCFCHKQFPCFGIGDYLISKYILWFSGIKIVDRGWLIIIFATVG